MRTSILPTMIAALSLALPISGCWIAPIISDPIVSAPHEPSGGSSRYHDCRLAASEYCRRVQGAEGESLDRCVAERTFECVSTR